MGLIAKGGSLLRLVDSFILPIKHCIVKQHQGKQSYSIHQGFTL